MGNEQSNINYRNLLLNKNGFVFKFVKVNGHFFHTAAEGGLLEKMAMTPDMVLGKKLEDFLPPAAASQKNSIYEKAWQGEIVNYEGCQNGCNYLAVLSPTIIDSQVVEVVGTGFDITELKKNERKMQEIEKLSLIGQLAAGIAHEIRNPLTSIKGFTQIIKEGMNDPLLENYLDIVLVELERINQIVNEFMFIAKPKEATQKKTVNINLLIQSAIQFMEPQSNLKNSLIHFEYSSTVYAYCDENQIKQVLINLIQNAIEATEGPNKPIVISLHEISREEFIIIIADQGCGLTKEGLEHIFEAFYSTKEKGTGLGLLICKRIIENHEGRMEISSKPDEGTSVKLILPKKAARKSN